MCQACGHLAKQIPSLISSHLLAIENMQLSWINLPFTLISSPHPPQQHLLKAFITKSLPALFARAFLFDIGLAPKALFM